MSGEAISLRAAIDELHDAIVNYYNGDLFAGYKIEWIQVVIEYFKASKLILGKWKLSWENISAVMIDRLVTSAYEFQKEAKSVAKGSVTHRSFTSTATSSANDTLSRMSCLSNKQNCLMRIRTR